MTIRRWAAVGASAAALTLAACGTVPVVTRVTTERAVGDSFSALFDQQSLQATVSLAATAQQLQAIDAATNTGADRSTPAELAGIAKSSIRFSVATTDGRTLAQANKSHDVAETFDLALVVGGTTPIEVRDVAKTLYLRADVPTLLADFGQARSKAAAFADGLQQAAAEIPGIDALGKGQWVRVPASELEAISEQFSQQITHQPTPSQAQGQQMVAAIGTSLRNALRDHATFRNLGTSGGRTEYGITVAAQGFVTELLSGLTAALPPTPFGSALGSAKAETAKIPPTQTVVVDEYVTGDKASELDLDLAQFDKKIPGPLPLRVALSAAAPVTAPAGATTLDLSKIASAIFPVKGDASGDGSSQAVQGFSVGSPDSSSQPGASAALDPTAVTDPSTTTNG